MVNKDLIKQYIMIFNAMRLLTKSEVSYILMYGSPTIPGLIIQLFGS